MALTIGGEAPAETTDAGVSAVKRDVAAEKLAKNRDLLKYRRGKK